MSEDMESKEDFGMSTVTFFAVPVISGAMTMAVPPFFFTPAMALLNSSAVTLTAAMPSFAVTLGAIVSYFASEAPPPDGGV